MSNASPALERRHPPKPLMRPINPLTRRLLTRGSAGDQLLILHYEGGAPDGPSIRRRDTT